MAPKESKAPRTDKAAPGADRTTATDEAAKKARLGGRPRASTAGDISDANFEQPGGTAQDGDVPTTAVDQDMLDDPGYDGGRETVALVVVPSPGAPAASAAAGPSPGDFGEQLSAIQRQLQLLLTTTAAIQQQQRTLEGRLDAAVAPVVSRVDAHEEQLGVFGTTLEDHERRIAALEVRGSGPSAARGEAAHPPPAARPAPAAAAGEAPPTWQPKYIEAKGWCTFEERTTKGLTREQCEAIVASLKQRLAPSIAAQVGELEVRGLRSYAFRVRIRGGLGVVLEVSGVARDLVASGALRLPPGYGALATLRWTVEKSEEERARLAAMLRVLRAAEAVVHKKAAGDEPQWSGVEAKPNWRDNAVELLGLPAGRVVVCTVSLGGALSWEPLGLRALGFDHPGPLLAAGAAGRR